MPARQVHVTVRYMGPDVKLTLRSESSRNARIALSVAARILYSRVCAERASMFVLASNSCDMAEHHFYLAQRILLYFFAAHLGEAARWCLDLRTSSFV